MVCTPLASNDWRSWTDSWRKSLGVVLQAPTQPHGLKKEWTYIYIYIYICVCEQISARWGEGFSARCVQTRLSPFGLQAYQLLPCCKKKNSLRFLTANVSFQPPNFTKQLALRMFQLKLLDIFFQLFDFFGAWASSQLCPKIADGLSSEDPCIVKTSVMVLLSVQSGHCFPQGQVGTAAPVPSKDKISLWHFDTQPVGHQVLQCV